MQTADQTQRTDGTLSRAAYAKVARAKIGCEVAMKVGPVLLDVDVGRCYCAPVRVTFSVFGGDVNRPSEVWASQPDWSETIMSSTLAFLFCSERKLDSCKERSAFPKPSNLLTKRGI